MSNESEKSKRIAKNTFILYVRMMFLMLISLYTSRVVLSSLGIIDYGIYNIVGGVVSMFSIVSTALTGASSRFLNFEMGKSDKTRLSIVFSTVVTVQYALAILIAILCEIIGLWYINNMMNIPIERLNAANWCFHFSVFNFCMKLITIPYNAAIIAHERMKAFAYVSLFEGVFKLIVSYVIIYMSFDHLIVYGILLLIMQFIIRMTYHHYCYKHFDECHYHFVKDYSLLKEIFSYSVWHMFGNGSVILKNQGVNLVLNYFFGPVLNAAKGVAGSVLNAVTGFATNFMIAVKPQITQSYSSGNIDYMFKLVYNGARFSFLLLFFISLPILINADYIMHIWLKNVPPYAVIFARLSLIIAIFDSLSRTLIYAQDATGNVRNYQVIVGSILLLNMPISFFVLFLGAEPYTVMYVALFIELCALIARLLLIPHYIKEFSVWNYIEKVIFRCLLVTIVSSILPILLYCCLPVNFYTFLINVVFCIVISSVAILYIGCSSDERKMLIGKIRHYIYS